MFKRFEKWELLNGEFMTLKNLICWLIFIWINSVWVTGIHASVSYSYLESAPNEVEITGIFRPDDNSYLNGTYTATIEFFTLDQSVPTSSHTQDIIVSDNFFRFYLDVAVTLEEMLTEVDSLYISIYLNETFNAVLPIASTPYSLKSTYAEDGRYSYDENVFAIDYENFRIGIGTANPQETLSVTGTVNATELYYGDGSGLYEFGYRGGNNYNYLNSADNQFSAVVTVNVDGKVMIGGSFTDTPITDLHVYGSLFVDGTNLYDDNFITGTGSRFMWYSGLNLLRIGYVSSYYWDRQFSGEYSIVFGHSSIAQGDYSIVTGGFYNKVFDQNSIVSGGYENIITPNNSIILGGQNNEIDAAYSVIMGGYENYTTDSGFVLGGNSNQVHGKGSIISGEFNVVHGDRSAILGGRYNIANSDSSMIFGSNSTSDHDNSILFNFTDFERSTSTVNHIQIYAENGMGINTSEITDGISVSGKVLADRFEGDGSAISNIKSENSLWSKVPGYDDNLYLDSQNIGVLTDLLLESLNVSGSIFLTGSGNDTIGSLRYYLDDFEIMTSSGWQSLTLSDTNTEYFAKNDLAFAIVDEENTFFIASKNVSIGNVLSWNGSYWTNGYLDQFQEIALDVYVNDLQKTKRIFLDDGNISIGTSNVTDNELLVMSDRNTAAYFYHNPNQSDTISISVNPVGFHFQSYYNNYALQLNSDNVAGQELLDGNLVYYVADENGRVDMLSLSKSQILIGPEVDLVENEVDYPFYVLDSLGTQSFVFGTSFNGVYLKLKDYYDLNNEEALLLFQDDGGELIIQSGPGDHSGDIIFQQSGQQVAKLLQSVEGVTKFGLTNNYVRANLDVYKGNIHVTDTYGIGFYFGATKMSDIKFDSTNLNDSITFYTSNNFSTPNLSISVTGNVGVNTTPKSNYDFYVQAPIGVNTSLDLATDLDVTASIKFQYDDGQDSDISGAGEEFSLFFNQNYMGLKDYQNFDLITISQDPFIGIYDNQPHAPLTIGTSTVLFDSHSIYFKETDQTSSVVAILGGDTPKINSSDSITIKSLDNIPAIDIDKTGLAVNKFKSPLTVQDQDIGFEVSGSVMVNGLIYDDVIDNIYPLRIRNLDNDKNQPTINVFNIDTDSGFIMTNVGYAVDIKTLGFYDTIQLPRDVMLTGDGNYDEIQLPNHDFVATKNHNLHFIGRGITIEATSFPNEGVFNQGEFDQLKLHNDLISGGVISGVLNVDGNFYVSDIIYGNGTNLRLVPYHWKKVTRNVVVDGVTEVHGEVFYMKGNVGIFQHDPKHSLEIVGTMNVDDLIVSGNLGISNYVATENLTIHSKGGMEFESQDGNLIFMRNYDDEWMRFTHSSQWLIGETDSNYLFVLSHPDDSNLEFKLDSNIHSYFDLETNQTYASIRFDDLGDRYDHSFLTDSITSETFPNIQIYSQDDMGFFIGDRQNIFIDNIGLVGIFEDVPKSSLSVAGNMSIGYAEDTAPENSLIIDGSISFATSEMDYPMTIIGHTLVGAINNEDLSLVTDDPSDGVLYISGDGKYSLFVGSEPVEAFDESSQLLFATGNMSIKEGYLSIRNGDNLSVFIDRDEESSNRDIIRQRSTTSPKIDFLGNDQLIFREYSDNAWNDHVIIDNNLFGIGGEPTSEYPFLVQNPDNVKVELLSSPTSSEFNENHLVLESVNGNNAIIGTDNDGFHISVSQSNFDVKPSLSINDDSVGINQRDPDTDFQLNVDGITNAENYYIYDKDSSKVDQYKYEEFERVPSGVIIMWVHHTNNQHTVYGAEIPAGWAVCNGQEVIINGLTVNSPDLQNLYVRSSDYGAYGDSHIMNETGGVEIAETSAVAHDHTAASHSHNVSDADGLHQHTISGTKDSFSASIGNGDSHQRLGGSHDPNGGGDTSNVATDRDGQWSSSHNHTGSISESHQHGSHVNKSKGGHDHRSGSNASSTTETHFHQDGDTDGEPTTHYHTFDNRPHTMVVQYIIKIDEEAEDPL